MRKSFLYFMFLILVGIGVMIVSTASAAELVTFNGKQLIFPEKTIEPADISGLKFDLRLPEDKRFVEGKVYRAQFVYPRSFNPGPVRYLVFTKWTAKEIEIFWWPTNPSLKNQPFLDCTPNNDELLCRVKGSDKEKFILADLKFRFNGKNKIRILINDGADAEPVVTGEIPMQFINAHKAD